MFDEHPDEGVTQQGPEKEKLDITSFMTEVAAEDNTFGAAIDGDTTKENCGTKLIFNVAEVNGEFTLTIDGRAAAVLPEIVDQFNAVYQGKTLVGIEDKAFNEGSEFYFDRLGDTNQFVITHEGEKVSALTEAGYESLDTKVAAYKADIEAKQAAELAADQDAAIENVKQIDESIINMFEAIRKAKVSEEPGKVLTYIGFYESKVRGCNSQKKLAEFLGTDVVLKYTGLEQEALDAEVKSYQQATTFEDMFFHEVEVVGETRRELKKFESLSDFEAAFAPFKDNKYVDPAQKRFVQEALTRDKANAKKYNADIQAFMGQIASAETLIAQSKIIEANKQLIQYVQQSKLNYFGDIGQQGLIDADSKYHETLAAFSRLCEDVSQATQNGNLNQAGSVLRSLQQKPQYVGMKELEDLKTAISKKFAEKVKFFNDRIDAIKKYEESSPIQKINALEDVKVELDQSGLETVTGNTQLSDSIKVLQTELAKEIFADLNGRLEACRPTEASEITDKREHRKYLTEKTKGVEEIQAEFNDCLKSKAFEAIASKHFISDFEANKQSVLGQIEKAKFVAPVRTPVRTSTPDSGQRRVTSAVGSVMAANRVVKTSPFVGDKTLSTNLGSPFSSPQQEGIKLSQADMRKLARQQRQSQPTTEASATVEGFSGLSSVVEKPKSGFLESFSSPQQEGIISQADKRRLARQARNQAREQREPQPTGGSMSWQDLVASSSKGNVGMGIK